MMSEWKRVKLSDICSSITYGYTASAKSDPDDAKFLRITDIQGGVVDWDDVPYCDISEKDIKKYKINEGDIVVARTGNSTGENYLFEGSQVAVYASYLIKYSVNPEVADPYYIWLQMRTPQWWNFINSAKGGSAQAGANAKVIGSFDVELPPLSVQRKIVSLIKPFYQKIESNKLMNATLEKIAQRIFKSWFVDFDPVKANVEGVHFDGLSPEIQSLFPNEFEESELGMIPKGWEVKEIQDVSEFRNGYAFKSKELTETKTENSLSVFKMGNILKGGGFKRSGSKDFFEYIPGTKLDNHLAKKGDLLMCMTDMKANVALLGHTALMPVDDEFLVNQRVGHIRISDNSYLTYPFLYLYTNSASFIHEIRSKANSGVQVNLSTKVIKESKIVVPPESIHKQFDNVAKACFEKIFLNELMNNNLSKIRDKLLPRLISGKITIQKAEELLEEAS
jgi:type I restriction enzyme S subunit